MTATPSDRSTDIEQTTVAGLLLVGASALLSLLARPALGETVRIRWAVGTYYGPETVPATLVLAAFPVGAALVFAAFRLLGDRLDGTVTNGDDDVERIVEACALATVGTVVLTQVTLVTANLLL